MRVVPSFPSSRLFWAAVLSGAVCTGLACAETGCGDPSSSSPLLEAADAGDSSYELRGWYEKVCRGGRWTTECAQNLSHHHRP